GAPSGGGMGGEAGRLGHHGQELVLVPHRDRRALPRHPPQPLQPHRDPLPAGQGERLRPGPPGHVDPPLGDGALDVGTRQPELPGHHDVQPAGLRAELHVGGRPGHPAAPGRPEARRRSGDRKNPDRMIRAAPITMALSAALNTGHHRKSMKSTTLPERPLPRTARSVRFPSAPPSTRPSPAAIRRPGRLNDATTMAPQTTRVAVRNRHVAPPSPPNAPPGLVRESSWTT